MSSITAPTYDPTSTAQAMAQKTTAAAQQMLTNQTNTASATSKALSTLSSAISAFQASLTSLTGIGKSMLAQSATLSDTAVGSASAKSSATAGSYSLFVEQVATANQASYTLPETTAKNIGGTLSVSFAKPDASDANLRGTTPASATFDVKLDAGADTDGDGSLSAREIAAAINQASGNNGQVSAGVITLNGETRLMLTSKNTGVANSVWLDAKDVTDPDLKAALGARSVVTAAKDAIVYFGGTPATGTKVEQPSNTFSNIDGVSLTVATAQAAGTPAVTLSVAGNSVGTVANVQGFVDAYNKLKSAIDGLVDPGNPDANQSAGAFAHDAGVRALQNSLVSLMRANGSLTLASYGITATRQGTLALDSARLTKQLAVNPGGLDKLIGSNSASAPSGIAASLDTYLKQWSNSGNGQIKQRTDANTKLQSQLTKRQAELDTQFDAAYQRYLKQFTDLQALQSRMNSNVSMFDALFSNDKSN